MHFYLQQALWWIKWKNPLYEIYLRNKKVLDMWCGEWKLLEYDKENIYWIDMNKSEVTRLQEAGFKVKLEWVASTTFLDEEFDAIVSDNVIEHLFPEEALSMFIEMKRLLKKDWIILLKTPLPNIIWNSFWHIKPYTPMAIEKLFRKNSREKFDTLDWLRIEGVYYYWRYSTLRPLFLLYYVLGIFIPYFRISYLMIIKKYE